MSLRTRIVALAVVLAMPAPVAVRADMIVELREGRRIVLPVRREEVMRVRFSDGTVLSGSRIGLLGAETGAADVRPATPTGGGRVLRVGPEGPFRRPSEAAAAARDGDVVEITAGHYRDLAVWRASDLVIRGVGGRPVIDGGGRGAEEKAVWVIRGARVRVENVELVGAAVPDRNGAGIRAEGADLELVGVSVHDNEMGILVAADFRGTVRIVDSEFYRSFTDHERYGVPPGHNVYVSGGDWLVLEGSHLHGMRGGHGVKSRARANLIRCNRIEDGDGAGSYLIDIAEAAPTRIKGNLLIQGPRAENRTLVAFGTEGGDPDARLELAFDTLVSEVAGAVFVANHTPTPASVRATLLVGRGRPLSGPGTLTATLAFPDAAAAGLDGDGIPRPDSPAADAAGRQPPPPCRFRAPRGTLPRTVRGRGADVGAFEGG